MAHGEARNGAGHHGLRVLRALRWPGSPVPEEEVLSTWLTALRRYLAVTVLGHLAWEVAQIPLYTIWTDGTVGEIAFAIVHCTGGDVLIALASLTGALILAGGRDSPSARFRRVAALTVIFGASYTVYSEWFNVSVRGSWAYAPSMPTLPPLGTGLTPLLQWIVIPSIALAAVSRVANPRRRPIAKNDAG